MLAMEEILCELSEHEKRNAQGLPPGFRFHPTDEELITFYLASKVFNGTFSHVKFVEVDLNRCEPWELPEVAKMGEREWYLFSLRDRKYPTGLRTNRATGAGYWKATGKDKEVYSASCGSLLGMKKTLVFYKGRAPRGHKTKWVMHEYRLDAHHSHPSKEEWVICRIFHKCGEKRSPQLLQVQGSSLPHHPLFGNPTTSPSFQGIQPQRQRQNDIVFPSLFQPHFPTPHAADSTNTRKSHNPSLELLFKVREQQNTSINLKPTKAEPNFFQYQILDHDPDSLNWMDKLNTNPSINSLQDPLPLEMDAAAIIAFPGAANAEIRGNMPSSSASSIASAFNRGSLHQILLDSPIGMESWPLPQHV